MFDMIYTSIAGILFLFLSFVWSTKIGLNLILKITFFLMFCASGFKILSALGFVVSV